jgi:hypothetical protein
MSVDMLCQKEILKENDIYFWDLGKKNSFRNTKNEIVIDRAYNWDKL